MNSIEPPGAPWRGLVVCTLGFTQLLAWGSTYYLTAVFADPISASLHVSGTWFYGAVSSALLLSGMLGPLAGRMIDRYGGRDVLAATNVVFAIGLVALSQAVGPVSLVADAAAAPMVNRSVHYGLGPPAGTPLANWHARLCERSSVEATFRDFDAVAARMGDLAGAYASGERRREYRDHRLEWMVKSGGIDVVLDGLRNNTIRFPWPDAATP